VGSGGFGVGGIAVGGTEVGGTGVGGTGVGGMGVGGIWVLVGLLLPPLRRVLVGVTGCLVLVGVELGVEVVINVNVDVKFEVEIKVEVEVDVRAISTASIGRADAEKLDKAVFATQHNSVELCGTTRTQVASESLFPYATILQSLGITVCIALPVLG
jgi:hypothetical protein